METVRFINYIIIVLFFVCYSYQILFIPIALFMKKKEKVTEKIHCFAILIAAKNEETVIGNLIDSLKNQQYPKDMIEIFVVADNCTDNTAEVTLAHGAKVFERFDRVCRGKGYALNYLLKMIKQYSDKKFDAYIVFDADNVVDSHFVREMNKSLSDGYEIATCYRNSKNYGDNWISAGYALWFLRESQYLNFARYNIGSSCSVSGTGFMFSDKILKRCGGWNFFCLTEDIEFTICNIVNGEKIGYCKNAVLYDEQPTKFSQSWKQRKRWVKGYLQVLSKYGKQLVCGIIKRSFSCFDMAMNIVPAATLTMISIIINLIIIVFNIFNAAGMHAILFSLLQSVCNLYITLFLFGLITVITEWNKIYCPTIKKVLYTFTFPLFMFTYIPICISALFTKVDWEPIKHTKNIKISNFCRRQ